MGDERRWNAEDLDVFKRAYALSIQLHRASLNFPKIEQYAGLADQLRRASKSVCGLIVEGGGRQAASPREFGRYLVMAVGSAEEARLWLRIRRGLGLPGTGASARMARRMRPYRAHVARPQIELGQASRASF